MKRHLAPLLFALSLCALPGGARAAGAQGVDAIVPGPVDSLVVEVPRTVAMPDAAVAPAAPGDRSPVLRTALPLTVRDVQTPSHAPASPEFMAIQGRSWKMPASRTLMIGGTALALVGLVAVKGDAGAIMALAGGGVAVYGLYLHYNH